MNGLLGPNEYEDVVVATYAVIVDKNEDPVARACLIASHGYPGTGTRVPGESDELRQAYAGKIISAKELEGKEGLPYGSDSKRSFAVSIALPLRALEPNIAMLLSATAGEVLAYGGLKLLDLQLPQSYIRAFRGPKLGADGIRGLLNVYGRPFLLAIMKPSLGLPPEQSAVHFREAALGGADIIKDDELLSDPNYSRRAKRLCLYLEAERHAFEETGEHTLYAVNITGSPNRLMDNALEAIELGANALMLNYLQVGLDSTRLICEDPRVSVPVLGHNAGASSIYGTPANGMSMGLINGKLPRLCGIDLCVFLTQHGKFASVREDCIKTAGEMKRPFGGLRRTLPIAAGGVGPGSVAVLCSEYGADLAVGSGGGVFGHPLGPKAGALAFRQAMTAWSEGLELSIAMNKFNELRIAVDKWGAEAPHDIGTRLHDGLS